MKAGSRVTFDPLPSHEDIVCVATVRTKELTDVWLIVFNKNRSSQWSADRVVTSFLFFFSSMIQVNIWCISWLVVAVVQSWTAGFNLTQQNSYKKIFSIFSSVVKHNLLCLFRFYRRFIGLFIKIFKLNQCTISQLEDAVTPGVHQRAPEENMSHLSLNRNRRINKSKENYKCTV